MLVERERKIYFKKLAYMIVEAGKSEICRANQQSGDPGKSSCGKLESRRQSGSGIPSSARRSSLFA